MPRDLDEKEYIDDLVSGFDASLWFYPETPFEVATEQLVRRILASSDTMLDDKALDEALAALAAAFQATLDRYESATNDKERVAILAELPDGPRGSSDSWSPLRRIARQYARNGVFHAVLCEAVQDASKRANRIEELLDVLARARLSGDSRRYLHKVARLFIHGFRLEAIVFARAALEAALRESMPDEEVRRALNLGQRDEIGLAARIRAAVRTNRVDHRVGDDAQLIAAAANNVLHEQPAFPAGDYSAKAYLEKLRDVLVALHGPEADEDDVPAV